MFGIGLTLGWQDIRQSYRRSALGQIWITLGMGVTIGSIGLVFGIIFGSPMQEFLPYLAAGIILWGLLAGIVNDGSQAFIVAEGMIRQIPLPKLAHLVRVVWRNVLTSTHNIVIFPVVLLLVGGKTGWQILLFPVGLMVATATVAGLALILAIVSTRFRDLPPIISSVMTVGFYLTPVIWNPKGLGDAAIAPILLGLNPFYHLLEIMRSPLLGQFPTTTNWIASLSFLLIIWIAAGLVYAKLRNRIPYWV